jgi:thiamine transporter ThiT
MVQPNSRAKIRKTASLKKMIYPIISGILTFTVLRLVFQFWAVSGIDFTSSNLPGWHATIYSGAYLNYATLLLMAVAFLISFIHKLIMLALKRAGKRWE